MLHVLSANLWKDITPFTRRVIGYTRLIEKYVSVRFRPFSIHNFKNVY